MLSTTLCEEKNNVTKAKLFKKNELCIHALKNGSDDQENEDSKLLK